MNKIPFKIVKNTIKFKPTEEDDIIQEARTFAEKHFEKEMCDCKKVIFKDWNLSKGIINFYIE